MMEKYILNPDRLPGEKKLPPLGLLFVNPGDARAAVSFVKAAGGRKHFFYNSSLCVNAAKSFFVAGPGVGAPMAVMALEKLIALGAKRIYLLSCCGVLDEELTVGDLLIGGKAFCGEGTSGYYSKDSQFLPSQRAAARLQAGLDSQHLKACHGSLWSTDAPYREARSMLDEFKKRGVIGVDMEYSALCCVAACRGIDFGGLFLVSDELWRTPWKAGFSQPVYKKMNVKIRSLLLQLAENGSL